MKVKSSQRERKLAPKGVHAARCIQVIDLGTQESKFGAKHKVQLAFELVDESEIFNEDKGEENFVLYRTYSMSLAQKASLTRDISSWLNKKFGKNDEFDLDELLNAPCQVQVSHNEVDGETYANISSIMAPKKGEKVSKAENDIFSVYLVEGEFDQESFDKLPNFIKEKISDTEEFKECGGVFEEQSEEDEEPKSKSSKKVAKPAKPAKKSRR
jgi:hypothetical protein